MILQKNIKLKRKIPMNAWRKLAVSSWKKDKTGTIYAKVDVNAENLIEFIEKFNQKNHSRITVTHFVAKALGQLLSEYPLLNSIIMGGKIYERETADVFVAASLQNGGAKIYRVYLFATLMKRELKRLPTMFIATPNKFAAEMTSL